MGDDDELPAREPFAPWDDGDALLLDSSHKRWFVVTLMLGGVASAVYFYLYIRSPNPLTGGSTVGLWYGSLAAGLMVYAGLLSYHRRRMRTKRLGNRQTWLRGHIWLGLLSGPLAVMHSGFSLGGPLGRRLWVVLFVVLVSGVVGFVLQNVLPRLLTTRIPCEAPYEQLPHVVEVMRRKADVLMDKLCGPFGEKGDTVESTRAAARVHMDGKTQLRAFLRMRHSTVPRDGAAAYLAAAESDADRDAVQQTAPPRRPGRESGRGPGAGRPVRGAGGCCWSRNGSTTGCIAGC